MKNFNRRYDEIDLQGKETYDNDPELSTFVRRVADKTWMEGTPRGEWKSAHLNGQRAAEIVAQVQAEYDRRAKEIAALEELTAKAVSLNGTRIAGYAVFYPVEAEIEIRGPYHEKLNKKLKTAPGRYLKGENGTCFYRFPVTSAATLPALIEGFFEREKKAAAKAAKKAAEEERAATEARRALAQSAPRLRGKYGDVEVAITCGPTGGLFDGFYCLRLPYAPGNSNFESLKKSVKELGATWDADRKFWRVELERHASLEELLERAKETKPAVTEITRIGYDYGNMHNAPRTKIFRHSDGHFYAETGRNTYTDYDGEKALTVHVRRATEAEIAEFTASEAANQRKLETSRKLERLHRELSDLSLANAERPDSHAVPDGKTIWRSGNDHDGIRQDTLIADGERLFALTWNGEGGDDWARNNAGSYCLTYAPLTEDLRARIAEILPEVRLGQGEKA